MAIELLLALMFALLAWGMALWVSAEVSQTPAQNRLESRVHLGLTLATQLLYVWLVQSVGSWRDALLLISVMLTLAWYAMLGLTKALRQNTNEKKGSLIGRLELSGYRAFAFAALILMVVAALLAFFDPTLALTIPLPLGVALFCTLWVPYWVRKRA